MRPFDYAAPATVDEALQAAGEGSAYLAGGTTLVDLMKLDVMRPSLVLDIGELPLRGVEDTGDAVLIGANEVMSDVAANDLISARFPVVAEALSGASPQIRTMASIAGNLLQRTRCGYFRDVTTPCNKREPGSGCSALDGHHRAHAILGTSGACIATHPSDLAVALVALDASVLVRSLTGERQMPLEEFYLLPGDTPEQEHRLEPGELVTAVAIPALEWASRSTYVKVSDRQSYQFALASAAVAVEVQNGTIAGARVAAGGVGTVPWRLRNVEEALRGRPMEQATFEEAVANAAEGAQPRNHNAYKPALLRRTIVRALARLAEQA